jgi:hypothetical protein
MQAVKFVVKLYDVPSDDGAITAFDSYGSMIFVGTDKGIVHKLSVEDQALQRPATAAADSDGSSIFTTLVRSYAVAEKEKKKISRLQHSRSQPMLFVLCGRKLMVMDSAKLTPIQQITESVGAFFVSTSPPGSKTGHLICAAEKYGRRMSVFTYDVAQGKNTRPILTQELQLPEPVQVVAEGNGMICVGLRREYSMLSLRDGDARGILALGNRDPLIAVGDGEVFLRLQQTVFSLPMKAMPTAGNALKRTMRFDLEPKCLAARHPFLFAFTESHCDVFSSYDDEVVERLPLQGCLFSTVIGSGESLYAASKTRVWMVRMHGLRHQLSDLVQRYKVDDAFHLLAFHSRVSSASLQAIEVDLHILAGFAHLYHCQPNAALQHINNHLDAREIILHCAELVPARPAALEALGADEQEYWSGWTARSVHNKHWRNIEEPWAEHFKSYPVVPPSQLLPAGGGGVPNSPAAGLVLRRAGVPHKSSSSLSTGNAAEEFRSVTDDLGNTGTPMTLEMYLQQCWTDFRDELTMYLRSKLAASHSHQRRAVEYALLQLYLRSGDRRSLFRLVRFGSALHLADCESLLRDCFEFRLLAMLLRRRGRAEDAEKIFQTKLDVAAYLSAHAVAPRSADEANSTRERGDLEAPLAWPAKIDAAVSAAFAAQVRWSPSGLEDLAQPLFSDDERDEVIFAVDSLSVEYLHELVRANPNVALVTDASGTSLISLACSLLDDSNGSFERVMTVVSYLVDAGCALDSRSRHGWTAIDVLRLVQGGKYFAFATAAILAQVDVRSVSDRLLANSAACRSATAAEQLRPAVGVDGLRVHGAWAGLWRQ